MNQIPPPPSLYVAKVIAPRIFSFPFLNRAHTGHRDKFSLFWGSLCVTVYNKEKTDYEDWERATHGQNFNEAPFPPRPPFSPKLHFLANYFCSDSKMYVRVSIDEPTLDSKICLWIAKNEMLYC